MQYLGGLRRLRGESGAVAPLVAILLPVLTLLAALSLDIGMLLASRAQLQRAVDAAALSAAEVLREPGATESSVTAVARQILAANGVRQADLAEPLAVSFPLASGSLLGNQVRVVARQRRPVYLLRAASPIQEFAVAAAALADVNTYAEVPIKPTGAFGKIQQTNPAIFGLDGWRSRGNVYSTRCANNGSPGACVANPEYSLLPYGYLFRIDVPPTYAYSQLVVELFDPDSYNNPATLFPPGSCPNPLAGTPSSAVKEDTYVESDCFGPGWHRFTRVDELRSPYNSGATTCNLSGAPPLCSAWATVTEYTLWHFDPQITNAFLDPATLSDVPVGAYVAGCRCIARAQYGWDPSTDLRWVTPPGFTINLSDFPRERDGSWYFYLYVTTLAGSSENNFDIRTGPPGQVEEIDVNDQQNHAWNSGGTMVFAKRAYPMNNTVAQSFNVFLTQVPANAAGQALQVRHYDNDCAGGCGIPYCLETITGTCLSVGSGTLSANDSWGATDTVQIPAKGTPEYASVFGVGPTARNSAWLKADYTVTFAQDTSVWELIYVRPRLLQ